MLLPSYIMQQWRGPGMVQMQRIGSANGGVKVQLVVRETNTKVVSFYEHLGFEVAQRVVMSRWLGKTRRSIRPLDHVHYQDFRTFRKV